jgi:ABC-type glycerol-3-phosphate transport system substrate-binding protein
MKSGRWIIALCLLCLSALVWAGGAQEKTQKGPVTLTVWDFKYGETEGAGPAFKEMDEMFMKKYTDIKVNHVAQPHDQYYEVVRAAVSAGSEPDVAMFHAEQRAWAMADYLVTLDEYVKPYRGKSARPSGTPVPLRTMRKTE